MSSAQLGIASAPRLMCSRVCRFPPEWFHGIFCRHAEVVPQLSHNTGCDLLSKEKYMVWMHSDVKNS